MKIQRLNLILIMVLMVGCSSKKEGDTVVINQVIATEVPVASGPFVPGVVFTKDAEGDGAPELFVTDANTGQVRPLSGAFEFGENIVDLQWSPDKKWIAFRSDFGWREISDTILSFDNAYNVFVVSAQGGVPYNASRIFFPGRSILNYKWSPDSQSIAFSAAVSLGYAASLSVQVWVTTYPYNLPTMVSAIVPIPVAPTLKSVSAYEWSPDSSRVAYVANQDDHSKPELFSVARSGGVPVKLNSSLVSGGGVGTVKWSPDSQRVAYVASQDSVTVGELYVSAQDTSVGNVKVSGPLAGGGYGVFDFDWAPTGSRIAYHAQNLSGGSAELYTTLPNTAASAVKISNVMVAGASSQVMKWSPDSSRIGYISDEEAVGVYHTFSALPDGSSSASKMTRPRPPSGPMPLFFFWAPDSSRIAYIAQQDSLGQYEVYTSTKDGSTNLKISSPVAIGAAGAFNVFWSPDSQRLAYRSASEVPGQFAIYVARPSVYDSVKVSGVALSVGGVDNNYYWLSGTNQLVYMNDEEIQGRKQIYAYSIDGASRLVSGAASLAEYIFSFLGK